MPVRVKLDLDTTAAQSAIDGLAGQVEQRLTAAGDAANKALALDQAQESFRKLEAQAEESLRRIREEAAKTAGTDPTPGTGQPAGGAPSSGSGGNKGAEKLLEVAQINEVAGALGDLSDSFEQVNNRLKIFSEAEQEAIVGTADLLQKGVAIGGVFGPAGAIVGGVFGAALGLVTAKLETLRRNAEAVQEQTEKTTEAQRAYAEALRSGDAAAQASATADLLHQRLMEGEVRLTQELLRLGELEEQQRASTLGDIDETYKARRKLYEEGVRNAMAEQLRADKEAAADLTRQVKGLASDWRLFWAEVNDSGKAKSAEQLKTDFSNAKYEVIAAERSVQRLLETARQPVEGGVLGWGVRLETVLRKLPEALREVEEAQRAAVEAGSAFNAADEAAKEKSKETGKQRRQAAQDALDSLKTLGAEYVAEFGTRAEALARAGDEAALRTLLSRAAQIDQATERLRAAGIYDATEYQKEIRLAIVAGDQGRLEDLLRRIETEASLESQAVETALTREANLTAALSAERTRRAQEGVAIAQREAEDRARVMAEETANFQRLLAPVGRVADTVFGTISRNIESNKRALAGVGAAFKSAIAEELKALARKLGVKTLEETAAGLAASFVNPPAAASHFAAAGLYGLAAGAAGGAGALLARGASSSPPAAATSGGSVGGGSASPSFGSSFDRAGGRAGGTTIVQLSGNMFLNGDDRSLAQAGHRLGAALGAARLDRRLDDGSRN